MRSATYYLNCNRVTSQLGRGRLDFGSHVTGGERLVAAKSQEYESPQDAERRQPQQHDTHVEQVRAGRILGGCRAVSHDTLRRAIRGGEEERHNQPFHWGLIIIRRLESGMNIRSIRMIQRISMGKSVRNRLSFSNFKCMK